MPSETHSWLQIGLVTSYLLTMSILMVFSIHRYFQVFLYYKHFRKVTVPPEMPAALPRVTIQLPMYNEQFVAQRVIEAACRMDYPRHLLQIQVLDDSTDESGAIALEVCRRMAAQGVDIVYLHRTVRTGFKAGALEEALACATGEFIAIFDADFVPNSDMLRRALPYFSAPKVACVQTRWGHLNRHDSWLTRCQAIFLDGHFMIEHTARNRSGRFINFNGTAGIWRKQAISEAGGWQHDTLTEDMDLSYRAQLAGWKMIFVPDLVCPAELPPEIAAFKQQQFRWTKGTVQTARKLLPGILRSDNPLRVKLEALFHLSSAIVYLPAVLLSLLLFPTFSFRSNLLTPQSPVMWVLVMGLFAILTCSAGTFYIVSQREVGENWVRKIAMVPLLMALGMGISLTNVVAALEGLFRRGGEFVRTPKYGLGARKAGDWKKRSGSFRQKFTLLPYVELALGLYLAVCIVLSIDTDRALLCIPFMGIFMFGYLYVAVLTFQSQYLSRRGSGPLELPAPVAGA